MATLFWGIGAEVALISVVLLWRRRPDSIGRTFTRWPRLVDKVMIAAMVSTAITATVALVAPSRTEVLFWIVAFPLFVLASCVLYLCYASLFGARSGYDALAGLLLFAAVAAMAVVDWQIFLLKPSGVR